MKEYINEALEKYMEKGTYPWHMPGHKRQPLEYGGQPAQDVDNFSVSAENSGDVKKSYETDMMWNAIYAHDFTEAKDLDDMHEPELFIADSLAEMRKGYGTYATYMLVNGSTSGIMTAIHAVCRRGDVVLAARNCHKAVYNAICMLELEPWYIVPDYVEMGWAGGEHTAEKQMEQDGAVSSLTGCDRKADENSEENRLAYKTDILGEISPEKLELKLAELVNAGRKPKAVIITSPTYEGVISDIRSIADTVHRYGIYLIVDEAQGAHLNFMKGHETAMAQGADIVIESLHKTMPALTQTSLLHVMNPELDDRVKRYLQIFQTSSPSYIFMQSMEKAVAFGANNRAEFEDYGRRLAAFAKKCDGLGNIRLFRPKTRIDMKDTADVKDTGYAMGTVYDHDEGRLVFVIRPGTVNESGQKFTGAMLADMLADKYGLIVEMASVSYVICISSVVDSAESYDILFRAMYDIDRTLHLGRYDKCREDIDIISGRKSAMVPGIAWDKPMQKIPLGMAEGRISGAFVYAYPPGIPVIAPGEIIDRNALDGIENMLKNGLNVAGVIDGYIAVLCED